MYTTIYGTQRSIMMTDCLYIVFVAIERHCVIHGCVCVIDVSVTVARPTFQLKTFGYFTGEYTMWYKVIRCPWMLVYCGCRHSLLHVERGQGMVRYL